MFSKALISTLALIGAVSALPRELAARDGQCTSSNAAQCCQNVQNSSNTTVASIVKSAIGIDVSALNVPIGTGCTPINILSGVQCNQNTVYCGTVYQSALIAINCIPIIINA